MITRTNARTSTANTSSTINHTYACCAVTTLQLSSRTHRTEKGRHPTVPITESPQVANATGDPAAIAAYRECKAKRSTFSQMLYEDATAIGHNLGPLSRRNFEFREEVVGLRPDGSGIIPQGWRICPQG